MAKEKKKVSVELYHMPLTGRTDDRIGRVVSTGTRTIDDLIKVAVKRRTGLNATTLRASYDILKEVATEEVCEGASVEFGLGYFKIVVSGLFYGDNASWNPSRNSIKAVAVPTSEFRQTAKGTPVQMRGMASTGAFINTVTDVNTGEVNTRLTPGGGVNLKGSKMKIGKLPGEGIRLIRQDNGDEIWIPMNSVLTNESSKISFIVPATLTPGDYLISISTSYTGSGASLKNYRTFIFDQILIVEDN